jgi:hypothetical protein
MAGSIFRRNYKRRDWKRKKQIAAVSALSNQSSPQCGNGISYVRTEQSARKRT